MPCRKARPIGPDQLDEATQREDADDKKQQPKLFTQFGRLLPPGYVHQVHHAGQAGSRDQAQD